MKKIKIISLVTFLMLWTPLNVYGGTADGDRYELYFDKTTQSIWGFDGDLPSTLVIPKTINGVEVKAINAGTFSLEYMKRIKIPDTIENVILANNHGIEDATEYNLHEYLAVDSFTDIEFYDAELYQNFYFDSANKTIIGYDCINGSSDVVIPSTLNGVEVKTIGEFAFNDARIDSVIIPDTVTSIQKYAFYENNLTVVNIPKSVEAIHENAFRQNDIYELNIANPNIKLYPYAFYYNNIDKIQLPNTTGIYSETTRFENNEDTIDYFKIFDKDTYVKFYDGEKIGDFYFDRKNQTIIGYSPDAPKDIVIPSKLDGVAVKKIGNQALSAMGLTSVTIEEGITEIGEYTFQANVLSKVVLPNSLTKIGEGAFYGCQLPTVTLPNKLEVLGREAFAVNMLKTVTVPASVKEFDYYVFRDNQLKSVVLTNGLETIGWGAFAYNSITSVDIPNSVVEIKGEAFFENALTSIIIPPSVTKIGAEAFVHNQCYEVELSNTLEYLYVIERESEEYKYIPATLEDIHYYDIFDTYVSVYFYKEPKFGDFYFDKATGTVTGYGLTGSKDVVIPDTIDGVAVKAIGDNAFSFRGIESVIIPDTVESIGEYSFYYDNIKTIDLPSNLKTIGNYAFYVNVIENLEIPFGVTEIGFEAFDSNQLKTLILPNSLKVIQPYAFCYNQLTSVEIPYSLEAIGEGAFFENKIKSVEIPSTLKNVLNWVEGDTYDTENKEATVESLHENSVFDELCDIVFYDYFKFGDFFFDKETGTITGYNEDGAKNVVIPSEIDGIVVSKIGEYAFKDKGITTLEIPDSILKIETEAFSSNKLKELVIPNSVKALGNGAFKQNEIVNLTLSNSLVEISDNAFAENSLTTLVIPNGVTYIGISAFESNKLTSVEIPDTVTEIGVRAFYSNNLREIKLPESVVKIVGYLGESTEKETYELTEEQLINLKVFDESVEFKSSGISTVVYIIIGVVVSLVAVACIVVGVIALKRKKTPVVDESNGERYSN